MLGDRSDDPVVASSRCSSWYEQPGGKRQIRSCSGCLLLVLSVMRAIGMRTTWGGIKPNTDICAGHQAASGEIARGNVIRRGKRKS